MVELRWLDGEDAIRILQPIIVEHGWTPLNASTCRAIAAFDEEVLIGFLVLQLFPLLGPMYVDQPQRDGKVSQALSEEMHKFLHDIEARGVMAVCDSPVSEKLCKKRGMKKVDVPVYLSVGA
jgi:hypothetical protein